MGGVLADNNKEKYSTPLLFIEFDFVSDFTIKNIT